VSRFVLLGSFAILLVGCASGKGRPVREVTATTMGSDQVQQVEIKTYSFYFDPNRIVVKRGVPVELTIRNAALFVPHNFSLEAPQAGVEVHADVGMFATRRVRFTPQAVGEFPFHCHVGKHAEKGMTGTLVIRE
jgi:FtsP/CotA-like multicopper oxidase with cupredoxin domain